MFKRARKFIKNNPVKALAMPTIITGVQFLADILNVFAHGQIDQKAFMELLSSANGIEATILCIILVVLKTKKA